MVMISSQGRELQLLLLDRLESLRMITLKSAATTMTGQPLNIPMTSLWTQSMSSQRSVRHQHDHEATFTSTFHALSMLASTQ
jgi:hypothetical protein